MRLESSVFKIMEPQLIGRSKSWKKNDQSEKTRRVTSLA